MTDFHVKKISRDSRIVLVMPSYRDSVRSLFVFHEDQAIGPKPPLGILSIASYLKSAGFSSVEIFDASIDHLGSEETAARIAEKQPDVVGFSVMTDVWYNVRRTCELIKKVSPDTLVCLGGPHVSIFPELSLSSSLADMVVAGDGEFAFGAALEKFMGGSAPSDIDGVFWKSAGGEIIHPSVRTAMLADIDAFPIPDRSMIDPGSYSSLLSGIKSTTMITSRGCPYHCVFCKLNSQKIAARSPRLVADEFESLAEAGFENIDIYDDTFTWNRERVLNICREIIKRGVKIEWSVRARVDRVDDEMLRQMKEAGCRRIQFGIESGNERVLKSSQKGITKEQVRNALRLAKELKFETLTYFLIGFLDETLKEARETCRFATELDADYISFAILIPYPGTAIYQEALRRGIIPEDYWSEFTKNPQSSYTIPYLIENHMPRETMARWVNRAHFKFYFRPRRILREIKSARSTLDLFRRMDMGKIILKKAAGLS